MGQSERQELDMYESVKKYLASLPETLAISTKYLYRSLFPNFFELRLERRILTE